MTIQELCATIGRGTATPEQLAEFNQLCTGFTADLGIQFTSLSAEYVEAEVPVSGRHLQPDGVVHGGVYCSIAETVGSVAGMLAAPGRVVMGINNSTDFIAPMKAGVITARCTPIQLGGRTQLFLITMFHQGRAVARTNLRTMVLRPVA